VDAAPTPADIAGGEIPPPQKLRKIYLSKSRDDRVAWKGGPQVLRGLWWIAQRPAGQRPRFTEDAGRKPVPRMPYCLR